MRRKQLAILMAAASMLAMPVNAMAAGSISGAVDYNNVTATTETEEESETGGTEQEALVGGNEEVSTETVGVTLSAVKDDTYEEELQTQVDALNNAPAESTVRDAFLTVFEEAELPQVDLYNADELSQEDMDLSEFKFLSPVMELSLETEPTAEEPVEVTFTANNMTDQIEVFILHYCDEHKWEMLETEKISDNQVTAAFHSASPVALIYRELPEEETETDTDVTAP
ncbi:MAG TPA: hypothetical protein IAA12_12255 [Candidatus Blautia intestinipullorum]|nr:hypothetical protein [Candidatus Blautia intestinipullorum]